MPQIPLGFNSKSPLGGGPKIEIHHPKGVSPVWGGVDEVALIVPMNFHAQSRKLQISLRVERHTMTSVGNFGGFGGRKQFIGLLVFFFSVLIISFMKLVQETAPVIKDTPYNSQKIAKVRNTACAWLVLRKVISTAHALLLRAVFKGNPTSQKWGAVALKASIPGWGSPINICDDPQDFRARFCKTKFVYISSGFDFRLSF